MKYKVKAIKSTGEVKEMVSPSEPHLNGFLDDEFIISLHKNGDVYEMHTTPVTNPILRHSLLDKVMLVDENGEDATHFMLDLGLFVKDKKCTIPVEHIFGQGLATLYHGRILCTLSAADAIAGGGGVVRAEDNPSERAGHYACEV